MTTMNNSSIVNWKPINISEIFTIEYGNKFDKCNMIESANRNIAFVTRTGMNNGVGGYVELVDDIDPYPAGCLTVALGGSLGATFLQPKPFYTAQNIAVLIPREDLGIEWTPQLKLFFATLIRKESDVRYIAFGRELNTHIKKDFFISVPLKQDDKIDWDEIIKFVNLIPQRKIETQNHTTIKGLNLIEWKRFSIKSLFPKKEQLQRGKVHSKEDLPEGDEYYYIGAKKRSNGVMCRCGYDVDLISKGNCIVFICNGQGSVGYALYMDKDFMASGDLVLGYNEYINKYTGLFLVTILDKERFKYSFGRKYGKYLPKTEILLPTSDGINPDWDYMERFVKQLPFGDAI